MRRSWWSRFASTLLAMWFVVSIVAEPASLSGSSMPMPGMAMGAMTGQSMSSAQMAAMITAETHGDTPRGVAVQSASSTGVQNVDASARSDKTPANDSDSSNCKQHDCCCSALSPSLLTPQASLAWIPEHVIDQATPYAGESVSYTEGQLLLPFANGPPNVVLG